MQNRVRDFKDLARKPLWITPFPKGFTNKFNKLRNCPEAAREAPAAQIDFTRSRSSTRYLPASATRTTFSHDADLVSYRQRLMCIVQRRAAMNRARTTFHLIKHAVAVPLLQTSASGCLFQRQCAKAPSTNCRAPCGGASRRPRLPLRKRHAMLVHRKNRQGRQRSTVRDLSRKTADSDAFRRPII